MRLAMVLLVSSCGGGAPTPSTPASAPSEPVEARCETQRTVTSDLVIEERISYDRRGFAFRDVQLQNGKVHHTRWIQRDGAGRPISISGGASRIVFRYGDHGELLMRSDGAIDALFTWKGRFFDVPQVTGSDGPMWGSTDLPDDLPHDVGVGFNGEVIAEYGIRSRIDHWIYDEHGRIVQALKETGEHHYTWDENGDLVRDEWTMDGTKRDVTNRMENHIVVDSSVQRGGVEELGIHYDARGRAVEARRFGKVIERTTYSEGCGPLPSGP